tara:strand:+ start:390 stop:1049 length:660 start_codon:yes stop_codon:yes gene_type:complete
MTRTVREWFQALGLSRLAFAATLILLSLWAGPSFFSDHADSLESKMLEGLHQRIPKEIGSILLFVYQLSGVHVTAFLVLMVLCYLALKGFWPDLICIATGTAGILVIVDGILKPWFDRDRPDEKLLALGGPSFPSGHAAGSVVFYFMSCTLLAAHYPSMRRPLFVISSLWVSLVWLSTLYCRAHWPSDILAGAAVGYVWLSFCLSGLTVWERYNRKRFE